MPGLLALGVLVTVSVFGALLGIVLESELATIHALLGANLMASLRNLKP